MVGLGFFSVPKDCKACQYSPYGIRRTFQPYWKCSHGCPFCYAQFGHRWTYWGAKSDSMIAVDLKQVERDYLKLKSRTQVECSSSCDPFDCTFEPKYYITKRALQQVFSQRDDIAFTFVTKSALVSTYRDLFPKHTVIQVTVESLRTQVTSPGASSSNERFEAIGLLVDAGHLVGLRLDPIIPGWTTKDEIFEILNRAVSNGVKHVTTSTIKLYKRQFERCKKQFNVDFKNQMHDKNGDGVYYFNDEIRRTIEQEIKDHCTNLGLTFATCMEHLVQDTGFCDPFHLLDNKQKIVEKEKKKHV